MSISIKRIATHLYVFMLGCIKIFTHCIPMSMLKKIPIIGRIKLHISDSINIYIESDAYDHITASLYWRGVKAFEPETIRIFLKLLKEAGNIVDIGANTGLYALIAAADNPTRNVYAFEPAPRIFSRLQRNIDANKFTNVFVYNSAATHYDGDITLYIPDGTISSEASTRKGFCAAREEVSVQAIRMDTFVSRNDISNIDLIKIDTEGTEDCVFEGMKELIQQQKPLIICEVLHGDIEGKIQRILDAFNYTYYWITNGGLVLKKDIVGDASNRERNYLLVPENKLNSIKRISAE